MKKNGHDIRRPRLRTTFVRLLIELNFRLEKDFGGYTKKTSSLLGSAILILLNPREVSGDSKVFHSRPEAVEHFGDDARAKLGLFPLESQFVNRYLQGKKSCFVFQCAGGREAFALAKLGFEVTGIDVSPLLIERAKKHAVTLSLPCRFEAKDMREEPVSMEKFDALFLTEGGYSQIITREKRVAFLKATKTLQREDGFFYLCYKSNSLERRYWKFRIKKTLAVLCGGNRDLEIGDNFDANGTFSHDFSQEAEILNEIKDSGWKILEFDFSRHYAVLGLPTSSP